MPDWTAWTEFMNDIEAKEKELGLRPGEHCLYRGEADVEHLLLPTLYRPDVVKKRTPAQYWQLESDLFFEFQARSRDVREYNSEWDVLFHMRHHGVPTRLLDWSEILGVAMFFAVLGYDPKAGKTPCIWLLNPWALNEESWEVRDLVAPRYLGWDPTHWEYDDFGEMLVYYEDMPWDLPVAIYPAQMNARMAVQRGLFTIHGNKIDPMQKLCENYLRKVEMDQTVVGLVSGMLRVFGVDQYFIYPDSENLAKALREKNGMYLNPGDRLPDVPAGGAQRGSGRGAGKERRGHRQRRPRGPGKPPA